MKKLSIIILALLFVQSFYIGGRTIYRIDGRSRDVNAGIAAMNFIDCFGDSLAKKIITEEMNLRDRNDSVYDIVINCDTYGRVLESQSFLVPFERPPLTKEHLDSLEAYLRKNQVLFWITLPLIEGKPLDYIYRKLKVAIRETTSFDYVFLVVLDIFGERYVSKEKYKEFCVNHKLDTIEFKYFDFYKHVMDSLSKIPEDSLMRKWGFYD